MNIVMNRLRDTFKKSFLVFTVFIQVVGYSSIGFTRVAFAEDPPTITPEPVVVYEPCPNVNGTTSPTGASAFTYTLNPATCKFENAYYIWDPVSKVTTAKYDQTPILNLSGTAWEYTQWDFSPVSGTYKPAIISIPVPPQIVQNSGPNPGFNSSLLPSQDGIGGATSQLVGGSTIGDTGPSSSNDLLVGSNFNGNINILNNTQILTTLNSTALSGSAYVMQNTNGGSALTGDAEAIANYLNMIQSTWNPTMGDISVFNAGLFGNFYGDLVFNPNAILNTGPSSSNTIAKDANNNLKINSTDNSGIQNDVNLSAISGEAKVSENTNAGNATSGDATTIANLINMINSSISTGQSFIGSLNIYGNLVGDLLLPNNILAELRNTGPSSTNQIANNLNSDINLNVDKNNSITNKLDLTATSGNALVDSNTNAGSATTGDASTSVKQLNVVGQNNTGTKGLVVFVNVLGVWKGMLWDGSSTASILGSGPSSSNLISNNSNTNLDANLTQNNRIVNNLNLNALSGDALVTSNTNAGNARSGDANSTVNLLNMIDSNMIFTDWFGVLFINVFGSWEGSFGVDTSAGNGPPISYNPPAVIPSGSNQPTTQNVSNNKKLRLTNNLQRYGTDSDSSNADKEVSGAVNGDSNNGTSSASAVVATSATPDGQSNLDIWIFFSTIGIACLFVFREQLLALAKGVFNRA